jgi:hypothetical protein
MLTNVNELSFAYVSMNRCNRVLTDSLGCCVHSLGPWNNPGGLHPTGLEPLLYRVIQLWSLFAYRLHFFYWTTCHVTVLLVLDTP